MKLSEYLSEERGRGSVIASILNVAPQQIYQWASGSRPIPANRCVEIESATDGMVTRRDLRPNDWRKFWPELDGQKTRSRRKSDVAPYARKYPDPKISS